MRILKDDTGHVHVTTASGKTVFVYPDGSHLDAPDVSADCLLSNETHNNWTELYADPTQYTVRQLLDGQDVYRIDDPEGNLFLSLGNRDKAQKIADALNAQKEA